MNKEIEFLAICGRALVGLALFCCCSVEAQFTCITNDNNELTITGYTGPGGDVSIPDSIDGLPVTAIATKACWFNANIINLTITNSGITIGEMAFYRCSVLATVAIGPGVTNIGNAAFAYNSTLLSITVDPSSPYYSSTGGVLFDAPQTTLLQCPGGLAGAYTAPATVTTVGSNAFLYCGAITSVTLPDTVTNIQDVAFSNCGMTNIALGTNLATIGANAFFQSGLRSINLPASVTSIGQAPFIYCGNLPGITVDALNPVYVSVDGMLLDKAQWNLLECPPGRPGTANIPATVTNIGSKAFYGCSQITNVIVPNGVLNISDQSFSDFRPKSLELPDSVLNIGTFAFYIGNVTNVVIGSGVTNIADFAFADEYYLRRIFFKGNAPAIGANIFQMGIYTGANPKAYYVPGTSGWGTNFGGLPTVPWDPISQCALTNSNNSFTVIGYLGSSNRVDIPASVAGIPIVAIGASAFYGNASIRNVSLPASVTTIGASAFGSSSLRSINLGSVTNIGDGAFASCSSLAGISFSPALAYLGPEAFVNCSGLVGNLVIPAGVNLFYQTFSGCTNLTGIYFIGNAPTTVISPFFGDNNLTVYYLPGRTGWSGSFGGRPAVLWNPQAANLQMQFNQFSFTITGSSNFTVIVEASSNLASPVWTAVSTNTLSGGGALFTDPSATNSAERFYRFRNP